MTDKILEKINLKLEEQEIELVFENIDNLVEVNNTCIPVDMTDFLYDFGGDSIPLGQLN